jgi:hypothetical protein
VEQGNLGVSFLFLTSTKLPVDAYCGGLAPTLLQASHTAGTFSLSADSVAGITLVKSDVLGIVLRCADPVAGAAPLRGMFVKSDGFSLVPTPKTHRIFVFFNLSHFYSQKPCNFPKHRIHLLIVSSIPTLSLS